MPTIRIGDVPKEKEDEPYEYKVNCLDRDHFAFFAGVRPPGVYEHTCPACGEKYVFTAYGGFGRIRG